MKKHLRDIAYFLFIMVIGGAAAYKGKVEAALLTAIAYQLFLIFERLGEIKRKLRDWGNPLG